MSYSDESEANLLDVSGLICPLPVLKARKMIDSLCNQEKLLVRVTDPGAPQDLKVLCQKINATIVSTEHHSIDESEDEYWDILIQKG